jgi:hypothetical protein
MTPETRDLHAKPKNAFWNRSAMSDAVMGVLDVIVIGEVVG